jgi:hypothetical protein
MKMFIIGSLIVTFSLLIGACSFPPASEETTTLEEKQWVLQSYGDPDNITQVIADTSITAEFNRAEGKITGSAVYYQQEISEDSLYTGHSFLPGINANNGSGYIYKPAFSSDTNISTLESTPPEYCYEECLSQYVKKNGGGNG